jgi:hypothetical protein
MFIIFFTIINKNTSINKIILRNNNNIKWYLLIMLINFNNKIWKMLNIKLWCLTSTIFHLIR